MVRGAWHAWSLLLLLLLLLILNSGLAQGPEPWALGSDRPSATRPELPEYAPRGPPPGFALPPVPAEPPPRGSPTGPKILIKGFRFTGYTVFPEATLQEIATPFAGRPITPADLEELRLRLTRLYVQHGYVNSGAVLPEQQVTDGTLWVQIVEGALGEIRIQGAGGLRPDYLRERLRLGAGPPLNIYQLQERFQLLLADPLIERMNGALAPTPTPGEGRLDLKVTRAKPYRLLLVLDNRRPPSIGTEQLRIYGGVHDLTGLGDALRLSLGRTEGATELDTDFTIPLTARDTFLSVRLKDSGASVIEEPLRDIDIESDYRSLEISLTHPVYRRLFRTLTLGATLAVRQNETSLLGMPFSLTPGEEDGKSRVSALRLSQDFVDRDRDQVLSARSTFSVGLDAFGSTDHHDRLPDSRFVAWLGQVQYARRVLERRAQLIFRGDLQLADDDLLPMERYAVGGADSVRGYRENELVRDQGYSASVELRYPLWRSERWGTWRLAHFVDYGSAWNKGARGEREDLLSVGVGLLWSLGRRLSAEFYLAHALKDTHDKQNHDLQDDGIHFRLTAAVF